MSYVAAKQLFVKMKILCIVSTMLKILSIISVFLICFSGINNYTIILTIIGAIIQIQFCVDGKTITPIKYQSVKNRIFNRSDILY